MGTIYGCSSLLTLTEVEEYMFSETLKACTSSLKNIAWEKMKKHLLKLLRKKMVQKMDLKMIIQTRIQLAKSRLLLLSMGSQRHLHHQRKATITRLSTILLSFRSTLRNLCFSLRGSLTLDSGCWSTKIMMSSFSSKFATIILSTKTFINFSYLLL